MLPNINVTKRHNSVSIQQVRSYVHPINQKTKWIGGKGFDEEETVKNTSDRCCRTNKAGIQN